MMKQLVNDITQKLTSQKFLAQATGATKPKKTRARRKRNRNPIPSNSNGRPIPIATSGPAVSDIFQRQTRSRIGRNLTNLPPISKDGMEFLKASFAPPDFAGQGTFNGIPDNKTYPCLKYRHVFTGDMWGAIVQSAAKYGAATPITGSDILIVQPPVPGVAFYWSYVAPGALVTANTPFYPVTYKDFAQLFGLDDNVIPGTPTAAQMDDLVNKFRMASDSIELICTSNAFTWNGSITAFKGAMALGESRAYTTDARTMTMGVTGLENFNNLGMTSTYISPSNMGSYMSAVNAEVTFEDSNISPDLFNVSKGQPASVGYLAGCMPGMGNLESNFIRLSNLGWTGTGEDAIPTTTFQVRAWSTLEYTPVAGTVFMNMATPNAELDEAALEVYRKIVQDLPVAVTYFENDSFWKRLLNTVGKIGGALSVIPGWGAIAGAAGGLASSVASAID
jgi:hypothetical protein